MHHRPDLERMPSKGRKVSATGGNRSWSEEEENYLLQTRMQKMPYKHIAAHLKKTELACRLHYHQLSHGSHRRKRTGSTSTASSSSSSSSKHSPSQYHLPSHREEPVGMLTPLRTSPNSYHSISPGSGYPGINLSPSRVQHKVLLPKPATITPDDSPKNSLMHGLRIDTDANGQQRSSVDTERLHAIYNSHRSTFWNAIAAEYGTDVSPGQLEDIWRHGSQLLRRPPTPGESPNNHPGHGILKPSPFPNYPTPSSAIDRAKEYSPMNYANHGLPPSDRLPYPMPTQVSQSNYSNTPTIPSLGRASSWSNPSGHPATAITALLTENKCPRHKEYCIGGRCFVEH